MKMVLMLQNRMFHGLQYVNDDFKNRENTNIGYAIFEFSPSFSSRLNGAIAKPPVVVALRNITIGEELNLSYGDGYWEENVKIPLKEIETQNLSKITLEWFSYLMANESHLQKNEQEFEKFNWYIQKFIE